MREAAEVVEELSRADYERIGGTHERLPIEPFLKLDRARQNGVLRFWLADERDYLPGARLLDELHRTVLASRHDASPSIVHGSVAIRRYAGWLYKLDTPLRAQTWPEVSWRVSEPLQLPQGQLAARRCLGRGLRRDHVDRARVVVRARKPGESCRPLGRGISKSLKRLYQELGIPPWERDLLPVVTVDGEVAAIADRVYCEPFAVGSAEEEGYLLEWQWETRA
jgi:tRNA(Ile)-lysidine synthase